jgi:hypothetical protein
MADEEDRVAIKRRETETGEDRLDTKRKVLFQKRAGRYTEY